MPRIRCHYIDCVFLDDGYCGAAGVELDPDEGCLTYTQANDLEDANVDWEDEELDELDEWDELEFDEDEEEEDDDLWVDDEF